MGDSAVALHNALYHLLHHRSLRELFLRGDTTMLGLSDRDQLELETIDRTELEASARSIARALLGGNSGGGGGLRQSYPVTLSLIEHHGVTAMEVMYRFLESQAFVRYRELPYAGSGLSAEEAFFLFLESDSLLLSLDLLLRFSAQHEMLVALHSLLTANPRPSFEIATPLLRSNICCQFSTIYYPASILRKLSLRSGPNSEFSEAKVVYLYAATRERFIHGPISPLIAELIAMETLNQIQEAISDLSDRHGVSEFEIAATAQQIATKGLIA